MLRSQHWCCTSRSPSGCATRVETLISLYVLSQHSRLDLLQAAHIENTVLLLLTHTFLWIMWKTSKASALMDITCAPIRDQHTPKRPPAAPGNVVWMLKVYHRHMTSRWQERYTTCLTHLRLPPDVDRVCTFQLLNWLGCLSINNDLLFAETNTFDIS